MSRQRMFDELRAAFNAGHLTIPNLEGLEQFLSFLHGIYCQERNLKLKNMDSIQKHSKELKCQIML